MLDNIIFMILLMLSLYTGANRVRSATSAAVDHFEIHQGTHILQVSLLCHLAIINDTAFTQLQRLQFLYFLFISH